METQERSEAVIENELELRALQNMLERTNRFALAFARTNHPGLRERLVAELRNRGTSFTNVTLDPSSPKPIHEQLANAAGATSPKPLFVYGLEHMFDLRQPQSHSMDVLNLNRDYVVKTLPRPVVFWTPDFAMREFSKQAPDFWSGRSGTFRFIADSQDAAETLDELQSGYDWNLDPRERRERREILSHLRNELTENGDARSGISAALFAAEARAAELDHDYASAQQYWHAALREYASAGNQLGEAKCLEAQGDAASMTDRYGEAEDLYNQALRMYRQNGDRLGEANCLQALGDAASMSVRYGEAEELYKQALGMYRQIGSQLSEANCLKALGDSAHMMDRYGEAEELYKQALPMYRQIGDRLGEANCLKALGDAARMMDRYGEAEELCKQALPIYRQIGDRLGEANCLKALGNAARMTGRYVEAEELYKQALPIYRQIGDRLGEANCLRAMSQLAKLIGNQEHADQLRDQADQIRSTLG